MSTVYRLLSVAALAFALIATPAAADPKAPPTAVVATTPHGTLTAADNGADFGEDQMVVTLRGTDDSGPFTDSESDYTPLWPDEAVTEDHGIYNDDDDHVLVVAGGAVSADVATVELRFGKQSLRMATTPGAGYHGAHAGQVRFYAGEILITSDEYGDPGGMLTYDASGTLLAQDDVNDDDTDITLLRRHVAGMRLTIGGTLSSQDRPLPLDGGHIEQELCLTSDAVKGEQDAGNVQAACQDPLDDLSPMRLGGVRGCGKVPGTLAGFVPAATRTLALVLGSGRHVRYRTRATPFGRYDRIVAEVLPRGEGIRTADALDAAGHVLVHGVVGAAPPDRHCNAPLGRQWSFLSDEPPTHFGDPPGTQVAAGGPGAPQLLVRETGDQVCTDIDALALDGTDCDDPPLRSRSTYLLIQSYRDGRTAVGVMVAAKVTAMNLLLAGGVHVMVPVTESPTYTGRLHSVLHFGFTVLAPGQTPVAGALLDASGRRVGTARKDECSCDDDKPLRTVIRGRLARARYRVTAQGINIDTCVALATTRRQPTECDDYGSERGSVDGFVSCDSGATAVFGVTSKRVRRIELELGSHRRVDARIRFFGNNRIFLALVPSSEAVRAVTFVGLKGHNRVETPLYAASRQCGYSFFGSL